MKNVVKQEVLPSKEEPEKIEFDLKDDESDSTEEQESEEEDPHTPVLRRSVREKGSWKGILHLISIQILLCLLWMMILELSGR